MPAQPVFSVTIRPVGNSQIPAGMDMRVEITLTNISKEDIYIAGIFPSYVYVWDVVGSDGQTPLPSIAGREAVAHRNSQIIARSMPTLLRPGESQKIVAGANILFDTHEMGPYTVQVRRKVSAKLGGGEVESNKITFTCVYNPDIDRLRAQGALINEKPRSSPTPAKSR